jgi:hypothetical protein
MNRRLILLSIGALFVAPMSLVANHPHKRPSPPAKVCKCGPKCRGGKCVRGCKCRCDSRCGDAPHMGPSRKPSHPHQRGSYHGPRDRSYTPSRGRGHDQNTRKPAPQPQGIVAKFDKNKDGRLDETERNEARKYFVSRYRNHKK